MASRRFDIYHPSSLKERITALRPAGVFIQLSGK
jgi:hypothetical protein